MNKYLVAFAATIVVFHGFAEAQEKPNIILIISDDQGFPDYGFMGSKIAKTPNLDRIASESLLYTRGYVMPVCSPSLATLLTGKMPHEHGITGNDLAGDRKSRDPLAKKLLGNSLTLPKAVTDAGYLSFQTGKLWNVTYKDVGFTHGMTATAGRHGDAGLTIGRKGMKPIFDFIETAKAEKKQFLSGMLHCCLTIHTLRRSGFSRNTKARDRLRRLRSISRWSSGSMRLAASWMRIFRGKASRKTR